MTITHGSLFSGVGGMDIGFDAAGIETLWQCEIDAKPRSVLAKHWPKAIRYVDVKDVDGSQVKPVDIITFGSPCQDLSIAGKRAGLAGSRSGLYHEAIRVIKEMRDATQNQYPKVAIWENVRGALSSNEGKDFLAAIQALAAIGAVDVGWRVVNACNFGVPQRRVRVFVVATFGAGRAGEILAKPPRLLWHPTPSGEKGEETTGEVEDSTGPGGWETSHITASTLQAGWTKSGVTSSVCAKWAKGTGGPSGSEHYNLVLETTEGIVEGYDEYNDKLTGNIHHTPRAGTKQSTGVITEDKTFAITEREGKPGGGKGLLLTEEKSPTLCAAGQQAIFAKSYKVRRLTPRECERLMGWPDDHTRYDDKGNEISDSARYKMCGNGIASPVAQWIGENIVEAYNA